MGWSCRGDFISPTRKLEYVYIGNKCVFTLFPCIYIFCLSIRAGQAGPYNWNFCLFTCSIIFTYPVYPYGRYKIAPTLRNQRFRARASEPAPTDHPDNLPENAKGDNAQYKQLHQFSSIFSIFFFNAWPRYGIIFL